MLLEETIVYLEDYKRRLNEYLSDPPPEHFENAKYDHDAIEEEIDRINQCLKMLHKFEPSMRTVEQLRERQQRKLNIQKQEEKK
jgi:hypothetical protein